MPLLPLPSQVSATYQINGGAFVFQYTYDNSSTAAADPGVGKFRMNSTAGFPTNVTHMYLSNTGANGEDFGTWVNNSLGTLLANGMTPILRYTSLSQPTKWSDYYVQNYDVTTYTDLTVSFISANGYPPSGVTKDVVISIIPSGGVAGPVWLFDGTTTTLSGVGTGFFRMNAATIPATTKIGLSGTTRNLQDWSGLWPFLHLTSGPIKARIIMLDLATIGGSGSVNFACFEVSAFVLHSGDYEELDVGYVDTTDTGGTTPFQTYDPVVFYFQWVGVGPTVAPTAVKTSAYNAAAFDFIPVDTTSAAVTVTLPTAPTDGTPIAVKCVTFGAGNNVTVATGGSDVFNKTGGPTTLTLSAANQGCQLQYKSSGAIWYVVGTITT